MRLLAQYDSVLRGNFPTEATRGGWFKLLNWNLNYGLKLEAIAKAMRRENADIVLLQEVDVNARRTMQRNVAEELARSLSLNYVFGIEFEELAQGSTSSPAYHGQAILSRFPIRLARILRFTHQSKKWEPRRYLPRWQVFQPRQGGRMALVANIEVGATTVVFYDVHLESQDSDSLRLEQIDEVLADASQYPADACLVLAGDFNIDLRESTLFQKLTRAGFRSVVTIGTLSTKPGGAAKDGVFVRGPIQFDGGKVHQDISGSDHFPVTSYLAVNSNEKQEKR